MNLSTRGYSINLMVDLTSLQRPWYFHSQKWQNSRFIWRWPNFLNFFPTFFEFHCATTSVPSTQEKKKLAECISAQEQQIKIALKQCNRKKSQGTILVFLQIENCKKSKSFDWLQIISFRKNPKVGGKNPEFEEKYLSLKLDLN